MSVKLNIDDQVTISLPTQHYIPILYMLFYPVQPYIQCRLVDKYSDFTFINPILHYFTKYISTILINQVKKELQPPIRFESQNAAWSQSHRRILKFICPSYSYRLAIEKLISQVQLITDSSFSVSRWIPRLLALMSNESFDSSVTDNYKEDMYQVDSMF